MKTKHFFIILFATVALLSCESRTGRQSGDVRMEIPAVSAGDRIIEYNGFTVCYDEPKRIPLWVAYEFTSDETDGPVKRQGKYFYIDRGVRYWQADNSDYSGSGWSRGHMAPAGDFKWNEQSMWDTFSFTNVCPQDPEMNDGCWQTLEKHVRRMANKYGKVYVVTGPLTVEKPPRMGNNNVAIPYAFFKVLLTQKSGVYHSIGFIMQNNAQPQTLGESVVSVNEVERQSGLDFFTALDDSAEEQIEAETDWSYWNIRY